MVFKKTIMLGFSITKLLFTFAAVFVVWKGFKWFNRLKENHVANDGRNQAGSNQGQKSKNEEAAGVFDAEEMTKCATCGTYFSSSDAVYCGKDGCPYPN